MPTPIPAKEESWGEEADFIECPRPGRTSRGEAEDFRGVSRCATAKNAVKIVHDPKRGLLSKHQFPLNPIIKSQSRR